MKRLTLAEIIEKENSKRCIGGMFGIDACKDSILNTIKVNKTFNEKNNTNYNTSLYVLLEEYVERCNNDIFFNRAMVLACWELINEK